MQQKQNKTEAISKKTSSFSQMMLQRDKNRLKEQQKHAYIELLKAPRGKKYLSLLEKTTELCQQLTDIEEEIKQLESELEQEADTFPASDAFGDAKETVSSIPEIKVRWNQPVSTKTGSAVEQGNEPQQQFAWENAKTDAKAVIKSYKEKQQRLFEMKRRQEAMAEQFRTAMNEFMEQLPAPDKLVGMIYPDWSIELLMKYGVIACPGTSYETPQELIEQVQPRSEQEERQWLKGDEVYRTHFCDELLLVEIYMEVVCVVYKGGNTLVIE